MGKPNPVKYSPGATAAGCTQIGNFSFGVITQVYGPTSTTGFWSGISPATGGYTVYAYKALQGPSIRVAENDEGLITIANQYGATVDNITDALDWFLADPNYAVISANFRWDPFPVWNKSPYTTDDCAQVVNALKYQITPGATASVSTIATSLGTSVWFGGTLAPNGMIYFAPGSATRIAKLDPTNDNITLVGPTLSGVSNKYMSGALAPNGYIYFIPYRSGNILKLDPTTDTVTTITASYPNGAFNGSIVSPQGNIYAVPQSFSGMLKIDTSNDSLTLLTIPVVNVSTARWNGAVLAADGKIYMQPNSANAVLEVDPATDTFATHVVYDASLRNQYNGAILGPDGLMYGIPNESFQVMKFDTVTKTASFVSTLGGGGYLYGGTMGPDGVIYAQGWNTNNVLAFNTLTNEKTIYYPAGRPTTGLWYGGGGVMAPNGNIYLPANNNAGVFTKISFSGINELDPNWALSRQVNHF